MTIMIVKYQTTGTEVYEDELGPTIGYDNIDEGYAIIPNEDILADWAAEGEFRQLNVICEINTIGM